MSTKFGNRVLDLGQDPTEEHPISRICTTALCLAMLVPVIGILWLMLHWLYGALAGMGSL